MAFPLVAIMLAATLASTPLQAADTGPATSPPSARERIDLARDGI